MHPSTSKPIVELTEKPIPHTQNIKQRAITLKVPKPESSRMHDKITPTPDYTIPKTKSGDDSSSRMISRKTIQDINREIPMYPDPIYRPLLKQQKYPSKKFL